jgi:hypothetical protein
MPTPPTLAFVTRPFFTSDADPAAGKLRRRGTPSWGSEGNKQITRDVVDGVAPNFGWTPAG